LAAAQNPQSDLGVEDTSAYTETTVPAVEMGKEPLGFSTAERLPLKDILDGIATGEGLELPTKQSPVDGTTTQHISKTPESETDISEFFKKS
jgi:hypothetical protein